MLDEVRLNAHGTRLRHEFTVLLKGAGVDASLNAAGALDSKWDWRGSITTLDARGRIPFRLTAPARVSAGRGLLDIQGLEAAALGGVVGPLSLRIAQGGMTTNGTLGSISAKALLALFPKAEIDPRDMTLGGRWNIALRDRASGFAEIYREKGDLGLWAERNLPLGLSQIKLNLTVHDNWLDAALDAKSTRMGNVVAQLRTKLVQSDSTWMLTEEAPLDGNIALDMQSIAWVRALAPQLDQVGGRVAARLKIAGTIGRPLVSGDASADAVQIRSISTGINLTDGTLRVALDGRNLKIAKLYVKAGAGTIEADGVADLTDGLRSLAIKARATRAHILASPQLSVVVSGTGSAGLRDLKLALAGNLKIDEGRYDLGAARRPKLGDDVVVKGQKARAEPGAKPASVLLDVIVDLNDKFGVRGHGLDAMLGGSLRVSTHGGALHALGEIRTVSGDYLAFGQLLDIERGRLGFSGPLNNPGLDLRAGRKVKAVQVGVEVSGSLQRPVVKLASVPAMSDSDKLGWLVLGRDPQTASAAELAILQATALASSDRRTTPIQKKIAEGLGLDEFGISQGGGGALGVVSLGKRISEQLSVRLEQTLGGTAGGLLKIDYLLSKGWRLEGTAGAVNAADVIFTLRFD